jgi:ABC-2 type transport system ATP-binding protein
MSVRDESKSLEKRYKGSMSSAILCRNLHKRYNSRPPVDAVCGLDLEVETGECFGLLGPNGAGKTTTLEIIEGLLDATSGEIEVLGLRWQRNDVQIRQRIGISLQETRLTDKLTVRETVGLFRSFYRTGIDPEEAIRRVSLEEKARTYNANLSGGQRQRLAVACALVGDPELLFLDEPTTGLDPQSRRQLWELINTFREAGRTVMLTTHYMDEAERLCDRVAIVDHGKVIALGTPRELISRLGGEHVITFALANADGATLDPAELKDLASVKSAWMEEGNFNLSVSEPHLALPAVLNFLQHNRRELATLATRHATLEDVFVNLTGRHLREGAENP